MKKSRFAVLTAVAAFSLGAGLPALPPVVPFTAVCEAASHIDESIRPIRLNVHIHHTVDEDGVSVILRSSVTSVNFVGSAQADGVEALQQALWKYNDEAEKEARTGRESLVAAAKHDREERIKAGAKDFPAYEATTDVLVRRADTLAVSLLECGRNYTGGVHGMFGVCGKSFDSQTGAQLSLSDVIADKAELAAVIKEQLLREYPDASYAKSGGESMKENVDKLLGEDKISWTLDPTGVSFYFNPYIIGSYSEGIFATTVLFDEHSELFAEKYRRAPKAYCMELRPYIPARVSFADGDVAQVRVFSSDGGQRVSLNGAILDDWGEINGQRPVLVSLADGRRYLYVDGVGAGDAWERTTVYDINGDAPVRIQMDQDFTRRADVNEDFAEAERGPIRIDENRDKSFYIMADPENFNMTRLDKSTGKAELVQCRVGSDGTPVAH